MRLTIKLHVFRSEDGKILVDLIETVAYVIAGESDLDLQLFTKMFPTKNVIC